MAIQKIAIIGLGNVGTHLATYFASCKLEVQIWSRDKNKTFAIAEKTNCIAIENLNEINSELCIICVTDRCIEEVARLLPDNNQIVVHTAGSVDINVFKPYFKRYGCFYPFQSFRPNRSFEYKNIPIFIEANENFTEQCLIGFCKQYFSNFAVVSFNQRQVIHLAGVFASNFVNACYSIAYKLVEQANVDSKILLPLILETAKRISDNNPDYWQTGPAIRRDTTTIEKHIDLLRNNEGLKTLYQIFTEYIQKNIK